MHSKPSKMDTMDWEMCITKKLHLLGSGSRVSYMLWGREWLLMVI